MLGDVVSAALYPDAGISSQTGLAKTADAVTADGRFLVSVAVGDAAAPPITVILELVAPLTR